MTSAIHHDGATVGMFDGFSQAPGIMIEDVVIGIAKKCGMSSISFEGVETDSYK